MKSHPKTAAAAALVLSAPETGEPDSLIRVAMPLPSGYRTDADAIARLEAALARVTGVISAAIEVASMELRLVLACNQVTPRQLVQALYAGLGEEQQELRTGRAPAEVDTVTSESKVRK